MTLDWNVRKELLDFAHRWPIVFIAFLTGSLLGWIAGYVLPSPYRAEYELYVAYNGDHIYRNPDDYKNWQLGELEAYIYSDEVLEATVTALRLGSQSWTDVQVAQIRPQLHTYWRNAGKWRLVTEWDDSAQATDLAQAWGNAVLQGTSAAIQHGKEALVLGDQARALVDDQANLQQRMVVVSETSKALSSWLDMPDQQTEDNTPTTLERWRLLSLAAGLASSNPAGVELLQRFPPESAAIESYRQWALQALTAAQAELAVLEKQAQELADLHADHMQRWEAANAASRNLTVDLTVDHTTSDMPPAYAMRPSTGTALVGGILGLLIWGFIWLGRSRTRMPQ